MRRLTILAAVLAVFVTSCSGKSGDSAGPRSDAKRGAPPPIELTCATDADCSEMRSVTEGADVCCFACGGVPVNVTSKAAFDAWCDGRKLEDCPEFNCADGGAEAPKCVDGQCTMAAPPDEATASGSTSG